MDQLKKIIDETDSNNNPISNYSRVVIEKENSKKLLKETPESPKQLQVKLSKHSFSEFVCSTIHDISSKDWLILEEKLTR